VIVVTEGGLVKAVFSDRQIDVDILDHDECESDAMNGVFDEDVKEACEHRDRLLKEIRDRGLLEI